MYERYNEKNKNWFRLGFLGRYAWAELTLSILQRMKVKDPSTGYIQDIKIWMRSILPIAYKNGTKIITNAGGANPEAAAEEVAKIAKELGCDGFKIGVVAGDDIFPILDEISSKGIKLKNLDTGEEDIDSVRDKIVAANAYTGADEIKKCLEEGADVVICGRVSDNALYVGPLMHEFGWDFSDKYVDKLGAAVTIGHIIECSCALQIVMHNALGGGATKILRYDQTGKSMGQALLKMSITVEKIVLERAKKADQEIYKKYSNPDWGENL